MLIKFVLAFGILALSGAMAGSVPAKGPTHKVAINQPAVVQGTTLKAGEYRVNVDANAVTFAIGAESFTIPAKVETSKTKYVIDQVQYDKDGDRIKILEICLGGTKTRLVFN